MEQCSICGGEKTLLGKLGNVNHFRCRNCGMQSQAYAEQDEVDEQDEQDEVDEDEIEYDEDGDPIETNDPHEMDRAWTNEDDWVDQALTDRFESQFEHDDY